MQTIRILIADDHTLVRSQICTRLQREPQFEIVAIAENSEQTVQRAFETKPQVVLIDPTMRDGAGLRAIRMIKSRLAQVCVIALMAVADTSQMMELRKAGVSHILNKGIASQELVTILSTTAESHVSNRTSQGGI